MENELEKTCCFTGHRPNKLGFSEDSGQGAALKNRIGAELIGLICEHGVTHFISGMALGVDLYAAETVLKLKEIFPAVTLECAVPCRGQSARWNKADRERYEKILDRADKVTVLNEKYTAYCMHQRNRYMVDRSGTVLAVWNGSSGGTGYTVGYAEEKGRNVILISAKSENIP